MMKGIGEIYQKSSISEQALFDDVLEEFHNALFHRRTISETFAGIQVLEDIQDIGVKANKYISTIKNWRLSKKEKEFLQNIIQFIKSSCIENGKHGENLGDQEKQEQAENKTLHLSHILEKEMREFFLKYHFFSCQKNASEFLKTESGAKVVDIWGSHFQEASEDITKQRRDILKTLSSQGYIEEVSRKKFLQELFDLLDDKYPIPRRFRKLLLEFSFDILMGRPLKWYELYSPKELLNLAVEKFSFVDIYIPNTTKIHELYEEIHGRDELYNTIQFSENGDLRYQGKTVSFEIGSNQYRILKSFYIDKLSSFYDIFEALEGTDDIETYARTKYEKKLRNAITGINGSLQKVFPDQKDFFSGKGLCFTEVYKRK